MGAWGKVRSCFRVCTPPPPHAHPRSSEREVEKQPQKVEADANSNQASAARIAQLEDKLEHANDKCSQLEKQVSAWSLCEQVSAWSLCKQVALYMCNTVRLMPKGDHYNQVHCVMTVVERSGTHILVTILSKCY